jgi:hypothetical protein
MRACLKPERNPAAEETRDLTRRLCDAGVRIAACGRRQIRPQVRIGLVLALACICGNSRSKLSARGMRGRHYGRLARRRRAGGEWQ